MFWAMLLGLLFNTLILTFWMDWSGLLDKISLLRFKCLTVNGCRIQQNDKKDLKVVSRAFHSLMTKMNKMASWRGHIFQKNY